LLRTVAANFSASGRKRQNNDLIESAGAFKRAFDVRFASGEALVAGAKEWALTLFLLPHLPPKLFPSPYETCARMLAIIDGR
jgi:hypothetical protein